MKNLKGMMILSKKEQSSIVGGGSCMYYDSQRNYTEGGLSRDHAIRMLSHADDHWCCDNCATASWKDVGGME